MRKALGFYLLSWPVLICAAILVLFTILVRQLDPGSDALFVRGAYFYDTSPSNLVSEDTERPPANQFITLPHNWKRAGYSGDEAWYVAELSLNVPPNRLWGIFLPSIGANAAVYLNDHFLGSGGQMETRPTRNNFRPLYFAIPNGMLKPEKNEIMVHVSSDPPDRGFLGPLLLGPDELLGPVFKRAHFIRVTLVQFIFVAIIVTMFYVGALAVKAREPVYGFFTAMLGACALFDGALLAIDLPVSAIIIDWFRMMGTGWMVIFLIFFIHRFMDLSRPRVEKILLAWGVSGSVLMLALPQHWFYSFSSYYWDVIAIVGGIYALVTAFIETSKSKSTQYWAITLSVLVMLGSGIRDWILYTGSPEGFQGMMLIYSTTFMLVVFAWVLLHRFTSAISEAATLNQELEYRIDQKEHEIKLTYEQIVSARQERALAEERERIMRDMHDGIGGQLISAIANAKTQTNIHLVDNLETALADLRLMIDSFEPVDDDLGTVLGLVRMRLEKRLKNHGLHFVWQVEDIPTIPDLGPHKVLHIMRILEEAVTNVVRHAEASKIIVAARSESLDGTPGVLVEVADDGKGLDPDARKGRGLENMRRRADYLEAQLTVINTSPGTAIRLWLPATLH